MFQRIIETENRLLTAAEIALDYIYNTLQQVQVQVGNTFVTGTADLGRPDRPWPNQYFHILLYEKRKIL